jgi:hypothetical protein
MCDSKELLVSYLYGELDAAAKRTFEAHLLSCVECREEVAALRTTRGEIALWTPPEPDFGFRIVRGAAAPPPAPTPRFHIAPAWGLAAAAVLVLAIGAAIANLEVRFAPDGVSVRTGWQHAPAVAAAERAAAGTVSPVDWKTQAEGLEKRLRDLERTISRTSQNGVQNAAAPAPSEADLQRVRELVAQSELRQQRALATRMAELSRDVDAQRRVDLAAIDQGMARLQNTSGAEVRQYRDLIQRMYRATSYQPK